MLCHNVGQKSRGVAIKIRVVFALTDHQGLLLHTIRQHLRKTKNGLLQTKLLGR